jgi:hypothetical protein
MECVANRFLLASRSASAASTVAAHNQEIKCGSLTNQRKPRIGINMVLGRSISWLGAALLCLTSAHVWTQTLPPLLPFPYQTQPTVKDVDPGIDHGNSGASLAEEFQKRLVFYRSQQPPGTVIVNTLERHLYVIQDPTHAMRYGIGVGRDGFTWQGLLQISRKAEWPDWHPPPEMIERQPKTGPKMVRHEMRQKLIK